VTTPTLTSGAPLSAAFFASSDSSEPPMVVPLGAIFFISPYLSAILYPA